MFLVLSDTEGRTDRIAGHSISEWNTICQSPFIRSKSKINNDGPIVRWIRCSDTRMVRNVIICILIILL